MVRGGRSDPGWIGTWPPRCYEMREAEVFGPQRAPSAAAGGAKRRIFSRGLLESSERMRASVSSPLVERALQQTEIELSRGGDVGLWGFRCCSDGAARGQEAIIRTPRGARNAEIRAGGAASPPREARRAFNRGARDARVHGRRDRRNGDGGHEVWSSLHVRSCPGARARMPT